MASWINTAITNKGIELHAKTLTGHTVNITSVKTGSGSVSIDRLSDATAVSNVKQFGTIKSLKLEKENKNVYVIEVLLTNNDLENSYELRQIGFYAQDPDEGEILYAIAQTTEPKKIPSYSEVAGFSILWKFKLRMLYDNEITAEIDPAGLVTGEQLENEIENLRSEIITSKKISGESVVIKDSANTQLAGLSIYGKSTQDTGRNDSPSPEYPQEIVSAGDKGVIGIGVQRFQLFNASKVPSVTTGGVTITNNNDGSFTITGSGVTSGVCSAEYSISNAEFKRMFRAGALHLKTDKPTYPMCFVNLYKNGSFLSTILSSAWAAETSATLLEEYFEDDTYSLRFGFHANADRDIITGTIKPMLYQDGDGTWEEFKAQTLIVTTPNGLRGIQVSDASIANYTDENGQMFICDEINLEKGVYIQRIRQSILDGSSGWMLYVGESAGLKANQFYKNMEDLKHISGQKSIMSSDYKPDIASNRYGNYGIIYTGETNQCGSICINTLECVTVNEWKARLAENPITVQYVLVEPIETPLSKDQIEAYYALHTHNPNTTVTNDAGAHMEVTYITKEFEAAANAFFNRSYNSLKKTDVVDNLLSDAADLPLSSKMGKKLNEDKIDKKLFSAWPSLPVAPTKISDGNSYEYVLAPNRVYIVTIYNSYNNEAVYIVNTGGNASKCHVTQLVGNTTYFSITPLTLNSLSIKATGADGYASMMCIGGSE